jgi:hypothetical protein
MRFELKIFKIQIEILKLKLLNVEPLTLIFIIIFYINDYLLHQSRDLYLIKI